MFFRGARTQRDGHGECGLFSERILFSNRARLASSAALAPAGTIFLNFRPCKNISDSPGQYAAGRQDRTAFGVMQGGGRGSPGGDALALRIRMGFMSTACYCVGIAQYAVEAAHNAFAEMRQRTAWREIAWRRGP
ncbi:MAG: hypothetical protein K0S45_2914 [Nitrospira sp.]|nr:hypothetical protein [Nitrospira sp.]